MTTEENKKKRHEMVQAIISSNILYTLPNKDLENLVDLLVFGKKQS